MYLIERIENSTPDMSRYRVEQRLESFRGEQPLPGRLPDRCPEFPADLAVEQGIPVVAASNLTLTHLIAAMDSHGTLMVRGLLDETHCAEYRALIDRVLDTRRLVAKKGESSAEAMCSPFHSPPRNLDDFIGNGNLEKSRKYHDMSGTCMCVESAPAAESLLELYEQLGLRDIMSGYLQDEPCLSAQKWVLRRTPHKMSEVDWHQDGSFMSDSIRSLNMWLALTECGGDSGASGLDIIPQRIHEIYSSPEGKADWSLSPGWLRANKQLAEYVSPRFGTGDAIFFDHFSLHRTQYREDFNTVRYAIETWFFASQGFPPEQVPMAW